MPCRSGARRFLPRADRWPGLRIAGLAAGRARAKRRGSHCAVAGEYFSADQRISQSICNHRKIVVIDGRIGYVGSQNIIDADFKKPLMYEEVVVRVVGPVVAEMQAVLMADRLVETGESIRHPMHFPEMEPGGVVPAKLLPSGPGYPHETISVSSFR